MSAAGTPSTAMSEAVTSIPNCGLRVQCSGLGAAVAGLSSSPSKRRMAAATAASRAPGRGGGGLGNSAESSWAGIARPHSGMSPPRRRMWPSPRGRSAAATPSLLPEGRHRPRALRRADELDELIAIAELVAPARRGGDPQHVVIADRPAILAAPQQLGKGRDPDGEARVL